MTTLAVGTEKGCWLLRSEDRETWELEGPSFAGWQVTAFGRTAEGGYLVGVGSGWFGAAVHRSDDLSSWEQVSDGPAFGESGPTLEQIWTFALTPDGRIYCGVAEAGVFTSDDDGRSWRPLRAFNEHPTRDAWQPGAGGMCAHRILLDGERIWIAASAVGVFRSDDAGGSFTPKNTGVGETVPEEDEGIGYCVHAVVADPDAPDTIWRQDHQGVYRTCDGGDHWERINTGLPADFGFPILREPTTGAIFVVPLHSDERRLPVDGGFAAWRSLDGGDSWHRAGRGWPEEPTYDNVLRGAADVDGEGGVYLGTTGGRLWASLDAGETWRTLPGRYPRINAVAVL